MNFWFAITALILVLLIDSNNGYGQKYDFVKMIAGKGIILNNDSILLNKTTFIETAKITNTEEKIDTNLIIAVMWDGFDDETLKDTSGCYYQREINYKSILFEYTSENDNDYQLSTIKIKNDSSMKIYTDTGFEMGELNPDIEEVYPKKGKKDFITENKLVYNLYNDGISLFLNFNENNDRQLTEIRIHNKSN